MVFGVKDVASVVLITTMYTYFKNLQADDSGVDPTERAISKTPTYIFWTKDVNDRVRSWWMLFFNQKFKILRIYQS